MAAGMATMQSMTRQAFDSLNAMGERGRNEFDEAFKRAGIKAQVSGQGSLMRLHLTDRPLTSYQSVYPKPEESKRMLALHHHLLNAGVYIAPYGLLCLSTANTWDEVQQLIDAVIAGLTKT